MMDSLASWDLYAPLEVQHLIARFRLLFARLRTSTHPTIVLARQRLALEQLLLDDLTFGEVQRLLFAVYVIIEQAVSKRDAPIVHIEPPLPTGVGDEARVRAFFARRSQRIDAWSDWRYGTWNAEGLDTLLADAFFLHDLTAFRQRPFVALDERYLLPDYRFALERLTYGAYWTVFDALSGKDRLLFRSAWGIAFEEYVLALFADAYPRSPVLTNVFMPNVQFLGGEIDALLQFGDHVVLFEVKSSLLRVEVRSQRDLATFAAWVSERLCDEDERGGLVQLAHAAAAIEDGVLGSLPQRVYPVLVTDETSFQALGVNRYLGQRFAALSTPTDRLQPLTVITTDELETLLSCVRDGLVTWRAILDRRARAYDGFLWIGQALRDELAANGRIDKVRRHPVLAAEYDSLLREFARP